MRKRKKPLNRINEARRKAHSQELFFAMLKEGKHSVIVPANRKGSRKTNKAKAIAENL